MTQLFSQADLERSLGGADVALQLLDRGAGTVDLDLLNWVINSSSGELASWLINIDLATVVEPFASALSAKAADVGAFMAWKVGAKGQPIPDLITQERDKAIAWAQDVGKKGATLGEKKQPGLSERPSVIDHDPNGSRVSIAAFKRGYR